MALTAHKTVTMFMRYVHTEDDPIRQAAETVASRRRIVVQARLGGEAASNEKPPEDAATRRRHRAEGRQAIVASPFGEHGAGQLSPLPEPERREPPRPAESRPPGLAVEEVQHV